MASTMFETFQDFPVSCFTVLKLRVRLSKVMMPEPQLPIAQEVRVAGHRLRAKHRLGCWGRLHVHIAEGLHLRALGIDAANDRGR